MNTRKLNSLFPGRSTTCLLRVFRLRLHRGDLLCVQFSQQNAIHQTTYSRYNGLTNANTMKPYDYDQQYAEQAKTLIEADIRHHYTIHELARRLNIGEKRLKIAFKRYHQKGIFEYLQNRRMELAKNMLTTGATSKEIAHQLGYKNAGSFSRAYKKHTGHSPQSPTSNII